MEMSYLPTQLLAEANICSPDYDGVVLVSGLPAGELEPEPFKSVLCAAAQLDSGLFEAGPVLLPIELPAKRLVYSPTGPIDPDYGDVRSYAEAAVKGVKRALKAGVRYPLLVLLPDKRFENAELVTLLGALEALYVPLEVREIGPEHVRKAERLGVWSPICSKRLQAVVRLGAALESGRFVARDIGGSDPERMAPSKIEEYLCQLFHGSNVSVQVIHEPELLAKEYPLFAAVNRAASHVPRHAGRVVFLTYEPADPSCILETLMLVGKGVTMDTGGVSIKTGGAMHGMSRDKCGAAVAAGLMRAVSLLAPATTKVVAALGLVRNSVGSDAYVLDEVITARSGARVRVHNTDAEGRFVMADILYHVRKMALCSVNPHIFTIATLTGHAFLTAGIGYTIAVDNSVARLGSNAYKLQACGDAMGDPLEVSILRRDDFEHHKGKAEGDDLVQGNTKPSVENERGHQGPAAFLCAVSGLKKHGLTSEKPIKYTHLDIAGSATEPPDNANAAILCALVKRFFGELFDAKEKASLA